MFRKYRHYIPFAVLVALIVVVYFTNIHQSLTLENLQIKQQDLKTFVADHPVLSPVIFTVVYLISVCLIIPDSTVLTLLGGLVFPLPLAIFYALFAETVGALIFFAIFDNIFKGTKFFQQPKFLRKLQKNYHHYPASYLLFLRLSHIMPFWLTNLSAAYLKTNYWTFTWTTLVGVFPLTYLLADAGNGLSKIFASGEVVTMSDIFNTHMKILLLCIALLAFVPIVIKRLLKR